MNNSKIEKHVIKLTSAKYLYLRNLMLRKLQSMKSILKSKNFEDSATSGRCPENF